MMAFRATTNYNYEDKYFVGDQSFVILYQVDFANNVTKIQTTTYYYDKPDLSSMYYADVIVLNNRNWFTTYIQYWHYISFA